MLRSNVSGATVRDANEDDAPACAAIYTPYVRETAISFESVGVYQRIGWKHGAWHDVAWTQRALGVEHDPPSEPR
jgi:L-amino acid N-acyltransferase YncA